MCPDHAAARAALRSTVSRLMRWITLPIAALLVLSACASKVTNTVPAGPWRFVDSVENCVGFKSTRRFPADQTVVLDDGFRSALMAQLDSKSTQLPQCWYETPNGSLLLRAGGFCGWPHEVTFGRSGDDWVVTKVEDPFVSCLQKARP
jgi:hypothetical protein